MLIVVDHGAATPLHAQIAGQVRTAIAAGNPGPGERLPPARELARSLDVNVHTVLRALSNLADEGLVQMRRGRGTVVTDRAPRLADLGQMAAQLARAARHAGVGDAEVVKLVQAALSTEVAT